MVIVGLESKVPLKVAVSVLVVEVVKPGADRVLQLEPVLQLPLEEAVQVESAARAVRQKPPLTARNTTHLIHLKMSESMHLPIDCPRNLPGRQMLHSLWRGCDKAMKLI